MSIKAVIFDLDGTLLDTEKLHTRFWSQAGRNLGFDVTIEDGLHIRSLAAPISIEYFRKKFGDSFDYNEVREERRRLMNDYVGKNGIEAKPFAVETLKALKEKGICTAVATATRKDHMDHYLSMIGADEHLDMKICASMVKNGKPAPDIYIYACQQLGLRPEECYAVEDSPNGVRSAYDAGCSVIFIPDLTPADEEIRSKSVFVLDSLKDIIGLFRC